MLQRRALRNIERLILGSVCWSTSTMTVDMMMERLNALEIMIGSAKRAMNGWITHVTNVMLVTRTAEVTVTRPADVATTSPADVANDWFYQLYGRKVFMDIVVEWEGDDNVDAANVVSFCSLFGVDGGLCMRFCAPLWHPEAPAFLCSLKALPVR